MPTAVDKLSLIVDALLLTGHRVPSTAEDGSNEWNISSAGYEKGLRRLLETHDWKFGKFVEENQDRSDPADPAWSDAYARPENCLHITRVMDTGGNLLTDWKILGDNILVNLSGGILVEFIGDIVPGQWSGLFADVQMHFIFAGIYRGLNKDAASARAEEAKAEALLKEARPRLDAEEPPRAKFVSSLAAARHVRRG